MKSSRHREPTFVYFKRNKAKDTDINFGLIKTCILIYFIELPAEELLYRGVLLIPLLHIINSIIAIKN